MGEGTGEEGEERRGVGSRESTLNAMVRVMRLPLYLSKVQYFWRNSSLYEVPLRYLDKFQADAMRWDAMCDAETLGKGTVR